MLVVDTSVLVDFLRGRSSKAVDYFESVVSHDVPFGLPILCAQEVLQGAASEKEWKMLHAYLTTQNLLFPTDSRRTHVEAARIYFDCRRKGLTIRSTIDCLIAQLTIEFNGELLHSDSDFEAIRKVRPLRFVKF